MPKLPSPLLTTIGLAGGFAVARATKNRPLGGVVWASSGLLCIPAWRKAGLWPGVLLGATYAGALGGSHPLAKRVGRLAFGSDCEREHGRPWLGLVRAELVDGSRAAKLGSHVTGCRGTSPRRRAFRARQRTTPLPGGLTGWRCPPGAAISIPAARNGTCNRPGTAAGSPGAPARPPRTARPAQPG